MMSYYPDGSCNTNHSGRDKILPEYLVINMSMKIFSMLSIALTGAFALTLFTVALAENTVKEYFGNTVEEVWLIWTVILIIVQIIKHRLKSS